jgi:hypothetical protein
VIEKYRSHWKNIAEHWARFGRLDVMELDSDTNNLIEAHFRRIKYTSSKGIRAVRLDQQIFLLCDEVVHFITARVQRLYAGVSTRAGNSDELLEHHIRQLSDPTQKFITFMEDMARSEDDIGAAVSKSCGGNGLSYTLSLADGSCSCPASVKGVCKHVEAASLYPGRRSTVGLVLAAAEYYCSEKEQGKTLFESLDEEGGIYSALPLCFVMNPSKAKQLSSKTLHVNTLHKYCSCHMFTAFSLCPHLLALLKKEDGSALVAAAVVAEDEIANVELPLRCKRRLYASPNLEPTLQSSAELQKLQSAKIVSGDGLGTSAGSDFINARCRSIHNLAKQLDKGQRLLLDMKLEAIEEEVKAAVAKFRKTEIAEQKSNRRKLSRQPSDRKHHPLQPNRTTSTKVDGQRRSARLLVKAAETDYVEDEQQQGQGSVEGFVAAVPRGRQKKTYRGLKEGSLLRGTKGGNKRVPRRKRK